VRSLVGPAVLPQPFRHGLVFPDTVRLLRHFVEKGSAALIIAGTFFFLVLLLTLLLLHAPCGRVPFRVLPVGAPRGVPFRRGRVPPTVRLVPQTTALRLALLAFALQQFLVRSEVVVAATTTRSTRRRRLTTASLQAVTSLFSFVMIVLILASSMMRMMLRVLSSWR